MRQRAHPGFRLLQRAADGTRDIPVDAVRDACAYLALTGAAARAKVLVVDRADDLNANGFNALLKSVEEPSGDAYIVLTSETSDLLPATLRSRCQTLRFHAPSGSEALAYLAQAMPESNERVRLQALEETLDAPLLAQRLLSDLPHLERYAQWSEQLQNLLAGGRAAVEVPSPGVDRELVADYARHASVWAWRASRHALATQRSAAATIRIAHEADRLARHLHANAQPRLALDSFMIACGALKAR